MVRHRHQQQHFKRTHKKLSRLSRHVTTADSRLVQDDQDDISKSGAQQRVIFSLCQCENVHANGKLARTSIYNAETLKNLAKGHLGTCVSVVMWPRLPPTRSSPATTSVDARLDHLMVPGSSQSPVRPWANYWKEQIEAMMEASAASGASKTVLATSRRESTPVRGRVTTKSRSRLAFMFERLVVGRDSEAER
ncbi:uncharacterized protein MAM_00667 [Metarhizium album ARSEF 1941]|uniref:Uncharacterized protein n=1 Tax=Metarhizium album (strain ARSEF 1941) TaxID=1081103 RepID=A0A0B2X8P1_METAS|nr:uncharacterized protein MAM_00667 [Metarhizium album ARSEF 1941]KHO01666.1 hypothetical protein MAM_00667 [Metarhizium album ARSEF 1941]